MTIDERLEALTLNVERISCDVESLRQSVAIGMESLRQGAVSDGEHIDALLKAAAQDTENIRALARIAEMRERRISDLEGE